MRKCLRCQNEMIENCDLKIKGSTWVLNAAIGENFAATRLGKPKVAICPVCGEISLYVEHPELLKNTKV